MLKDADPMLYWPENKTQKSQQRQNMAHILLIAFFYIYFYEQNVALFLRWEQKINLSRVTKVDGVA